MKTRIIALLRIVKAALPTQMRRALARVSHSLDTSYQLLLSEQAQLQQDFSRLRVSFDELAEKHQTSQTAMDQLVDEHRSLQSLNVDLSESYKELQASLRKLQAEHQALGDEHATLVALRDSLETANRRLDEKNEKLRQVTEQQEQSRQELETIVKRMREEQQTISERYVALSADHERVSASNIALAQDNEALRVSIQTFQSTLLHLRSVHEKLQEEHQTLASNQIVLTELRDKLQSVNAQLLRDKDTADRENESLKAANSNLDTDNAALRRQIESSTEKYRQLEEHIGGLKNSDEQLTQTLEQSREELHILRDTSSNLASVLATSEKKADLLRHFAARNFPIYLNADMRPVARPVRGNCAHRAMIVSIPKAGTYLFALLLRKLGLEPTNLHLNVDGLSDYRFASIRQAREEYLRFAVDIPLERSVKLIGEGQFAVGHLPCTADVRSSLTGFKIVFLCRDLRDAIISQMRFFSTPGRGQGRDSAWKSIEEGPNKLIAFMESFGDEFIGLYQSMVDWRDVHGICRVSFEEIYGDLGSDRAIETVGKVADHFGVPRTSLDCSKILSSIIGVETKTWSGERTRRSDFWDRRVDKQFERLGGYEMNRLLGYQRDELEQMGYADAFSK